MGYKAIPNIGATSLLVVDGHNLAHAGSHDKHRADRPHAVAEAVLSYLKKTVAALTPVKVVVTWDTGLAPWRKKLYPDYKLNRKKKVRSEQEKQANTQRLEDMNVDINFLQSFVLPVLGIDQLIGDGPTEADDLIYSVIQDYKKNTRFSSAVILSTDQDMVQLLTPTNSTLYKNNPSYNVFQLSIMKLYISRDEWQAGERISHRLVDGKAVRDKKGWWPEDHLFIRSITGDPSDGITGIDGVGAGFCRDMIKGYASVNKIMQLHMAGELSWVDMVTKGKKTKLKKVLSKPCLQIIQRNMQLMTLQEPKKKPSLIPGRAFEGLTGATVIDNMVRTLKKHKAEPWGNGVDPFQWLSPFRDYCATRAQRYRLSKKGGKA